MKLSIDKKWKWAAMDKDQSWSFYMDKPEIGYNEWQPSNPDKEESVILRYITVSSIIKDLPFSSDWKESLHQIINGQLVKFELPKELPAVIRAREILEEIGYFDVQETPAEQLKPLVKLIKAYNLFKNLHEWRLAEENKSLMD